MLTLITYIGLLTSGVAAAAFIYLALIKLELI